MERVEQSVGRRLLNATRNAARGSWLIVRSGARMMVGDRTRAFQDSLDGERLLGHALAVLFLSDEERARARAERGGGVDA